MRRMLLTGLALISLAACGGAKEQAQARPPAVKKAGTMPKVRARTTTPKVTVRTTTPKGKNSTPARKAARAVPAPADTATPRNPLQNH